MQTKKDYSYGIIPIRYTANGGIEYLVIYQYSKIKDNYYWIFPKGHAEPDETPIESARRELKEETGLAAEINDAKTFHLFYSFEADGVLINKEVVFHIGVVESGEFQLQVGEVAKAEWLVYAEARERLTNENSKLLLDEVESYLGRK